MADPENQSAPLLRSPSLQTASIPANGSSSSRAWKVAGITLLACLLIAGQILTAYFVFSQSGEIKSLEEQSRTMKAKMERGKAGAASVQVHVPMNTMLVDGAVDKENSTEIQGKRGILSRMMAMPYAMQLEED